MNGKGRELTSTMGSEVYDVLTALLNHLDISSELPSLPSQRVYCQRVLIL